MLAHPRKGSRKLRKLMENEKPKARTRISAKFIESVGLEIDYNRNAELASIWSKYKIPNLLGEFTYRLVTNRLPVNSRRAHYSDISASCTFCSMNYARKRKNLMGKAQGPIQIDKETPMHLFFDCTLVKRDMGNDWGLKTALQPTVSSYVKFRGRLEMNLELLMRIWKCKTRGILP